MAKPKTSSRLEHDLKALIEMPVESPPKPLFSEFQRGALWAMKLLQGQLQARRDALRSITFDDRRMSADEGGMLSSVSNIYCGIETKFETELMKGLADAEKEFKP